MNTLSGHDINKLCYYFNGKVYMLYDANYTRIEGYLYTPNQVKYYAKKRGYTGIRSVDYFFVEKSFNMVEARHQMNLTRKD